MLYMAQGVWRPGQGFAGHLIKYNVIFYEQLFCEDFLLGIQV